MSADAERRELHSQAELGNERKRQIEIAWLEQVLDDPEWVETDSSEPALEHRLRRIAGFDNRVLRVIVRRSGTLMVVVTVYFDRRSTRT